MAAPPRRPDNRRRSRRVNELSKPFEELAYQLLLQGKKDWSQVVSAMLTATFDVYLNRVDSGSYEYPRDRQYYRVRQWEFMYRAEAIMHLSLRDYGYPRPMPRKYDEYPE